MTVPAIDRLPARPRTRSRVIVVVMAVTAFLGIGDGVDGSAWAQPTRVGKTVGIPSPGVRAAADGGIDADRVVDSIRHRVHPVTGRAGEWMASDRQYDARFRTSGFQLRSTATGTGLGVSLRSVERGGRRLPVDTGSWGAEANRAERTVGSGMREVVTARDGEIEWDLVLARAPAGRGDLVVTASLDGSTSGVAERVGALVVKDAAGRSLFRAMPMVDTHRVRLVVPDRILSQVRYPLTLDPTVGPEKIVTTAGGVQDTPDIAFDGTNYLVVWEDSRNGNQDIYGARVRKDGTVIDALGFPISTAAGDQTAPVVAYYGPGYLVVWNDVHAGSDIFVGVYGTRVSTSGAVLDSRSIEFSTEGLASQAAIAAQGGQALVVWSEGNNDILGTRWSPTTGVQDLAGLLISTAARSQVDPAVISYGSGYLVAWTDYRTDDNGDIWGARVDPANGVLDHTGIPLSTTADAQVLPALAFDGHVVLVVWTDGRHPTWDIYGARWDPASGLLDGSGLAISTAVTSQSVPDVVANGSFLVLWEDQRRGQADVYGARVTRDGVVSDPDGFLVTGGGGHRPAVIKGNGSSWALTYDRGGEILFATVAPK